MSKIVNYRNSSNDVIEISDIYAGVEKKNINTGKVTRYLGYITGQEKIEKINELMIRDHCHDETWYINQSKTKSAAEFIAKNL